MGLFHFDGSAWKDYNSVSVRLFKNRLALGLTLFDSKGLSCNKYTFPNGSRVVLVDFGLGSFSVSY
jgi:hypothetical protein